MRKGTKMSDETKEKIRQAAKKRIGTKYCLAQLPNKNLIIYFDQYQIGPSALGAIVFPLPLDKIKDFLQ